MEILITCRTDGHVNESANFSPYKLPSDQYVDIGKSMGVWWQLTKDW